MRNRVGADSDAVSYREVQRLQNARTQQFRSVRKRR